MASSFLARTKPNPAMVNNTLTRLVDWVKQIILEPIRQASPLSGQDKVSDKGARSLVRYANSVPDRPGHPCKDKNGSPNKRREAFFDKSLRYAICDLDRTGYSPSNHHEPFPLLVCEVTTVHSPTYYVSVITVYRICRESP